MYIFINEFTVLPYAGEVLKRYVGNKLVKVIANPTEKDLKEFGYMPLIETEVPDCDVETQYILKRYELVDGEIFESYTVVDITIDENEG